MRGSLSRGEARDGAEPDGCPGRKTPNRFTLRGGEKVDAQ